MTHSQHSYDIFTDKETYIHRDRIAVTEGATVSFLDAWLQARRKYHTISV